MNPDPKINPGKVGEIKCGLTLYNQSIGIAILDQETRDSIKKETNIYSYFFSSFECLIGITFGNWSLPNFACAVFANVDMNLLIDSIHSSLMPA